MCKNSSKDDQQQPSNSLKLLAFICSNAIFLLVAFLTITIYIIGPFYYPKTIGLFVTVPYLTYTLLISRDELNTGNQWPTFSKHFFLFRIMRRYLQLDFSCVPRELLGNRDKDTSSTNSQNTTSTNSNLDKTSKQFIFAIFPHGTNSDFRILMDGKIPDLIPNIGTNCRVLTASILFRLPLVREFALWTSCVDARRSVAERVLDKGLSLMVLPGGEAEQIRTVRGKEIVYLSKRKGFVKLALRKNIPVVPVYVFGSSDLFYTSRAFFGARNWLVKHMGICIPLSSGVFGSMCPLAVKQTIAFGKPLFFEIKKEGNPTGEELDECHAKFCNALVSLFDEHKGNLGYGDRSLEIV